MSSASQAAQGNAFLEQAINLLVANRQQMLQGDTERRLLSQYNAYINDVINPWNEELYQQMLDNMQSGYDNSLAAITGAMNNPAGEGDFKNALNDVDNSYLDALNAMGAIGDDEIEDIKRAYAEERGRTQVKLGNTGLGNTTAGMGVMARLTRDQADAIRKARNAQAVRDAGIRSDAANARLNALQRWAEGSRSQQASLASTMAQMETAYADRNVQVRNAQMRQAPPIEQFTGYNPEPEEAVAEEEAKKPQARVETRRDNRQARVETRRDNRQARVEKRRDNRQARVEKRRDNRQARVETRRDNRQTRRQDRRDKFAALLGR